MLNAQDIRTALQAAEEGNIGPIKKTLTDKNLSANDRLFLSALIETDAEKAVATYLNLLQTDKKYAYRDAVLYRIYSYYYSVGSYKSAEKYALQLSSEFPGSSYLKKLARDFQESTPEVTHEEKTTKPVKKDTPENTGKTPSKTEYKFTIQAGVFSKEENARQFKEEISKAYKIDCFTGKRTIGGTEFIVVYAGKFKTEDAADKVRDKMKAKINGVKTIELPAGL